LSELVLTLDQDLVLVGDKGGVPGASAKFDYLVENQVVSNKTWLALMNLDLMQVSVLRQVLVAELDVRVDTHASTPDKHFVAVRQCHAMIVPEADVFDVLRAARRVRVPVDKVDFGGPLNVEGTFLQTAKLAIIVVAPGMDGALRGQHSSKKVTADHLNDWDVEVDHIGD